MKVTKRKAKGVLADMIANMDENSLARTREKMEKISMEKNLVEDYVSFEVAKLLEEKGFDEFCDAIYIILPNGDYRYSKIDYPHKNSVDTKPVAIMCPTHQMAMKWLREVHELFVDISFVKYEDREEKLFWYYAVFELSYDNEAHYNNVDEFATYEEAVEAAIKFSLENLI